MWVILDGSVVVKTGTAEGGAGETTMKLIAGETVGEKEQLDGGAHAHTVVAWPQHVIVAKLPEE